MSQLEDPKYEIDRLVTSAGDALSDEIVSRLGQLINDLLVIADKLSRNDCLMKAIDLLDDDKLMKDVKPSKGGIGGMIKIMSDPDVQYALQYMGKLMKEVQSEK